MVKAGSVFLGLIAACALMTSVRAADDLPVLGVSEIYASKALATSIKTAKIDTQELARQIEESVRATRRFKLVERDLAVMNNSIFKEQEYIDVKNSSALSGETLKMISGLDYLIQPIVVSFTISIRKAPKEEDPNKLLYTCSGAAAVTVKLLKPVDKDSKVGDKREAGEIKYQTTRETELKSTANACKNITSDDDTAATFEAWRVMSRDLAQKITNAAVGYIFPVLVMQVRGDDIFVNRGEGAGINPGEIYEIYSVGEDMIDPATNESLGSEEILLGEVKITRVNPKFSIATAVPGKPLKDKPKAKDVLRAPQ